ncbi:MAG: PEP-CTERM sorting domain-containing protein [Bryobacteraceae bacterium]|nr:PEP-CTERM sorting domain-containing protein [Bryobacteraceae bacterium]
MRSLSVLTLLAASCTLANASIISQVCGAINTSAIAGGALVNNGSVTVSCGGFTAPIGQSIINISFSFLGTFSDSDGNNGLHQLTFNGTTPFGSGAFGPFNTGSDGDVGSTGNQNSLSSAVLSQNGLAGFNVTVTTANTVGGNALPDTGQFTVRAVYTYEVDQQPGGVPEPSTLALVGGVLVLAGLRKFRK